MRSSLGGEPLPLFLAPQATTLQLAQARKGGTIPMRYTFLRRPKEHQRPLPRERRVRYTCLRSFGLECAESLLGVDFGRPRRVGCGLWWMVA